MVKMAIIFIGLIQDFTDLTHLQIKGDSHTMPNQKVHRNTDTYPPPLPSPNPFWIYLNNPTEIDQLNIG